MSHSGCYATFVSLLQVAIKIIPKSRVFGWAKVSDNINILSSFWVYWCIEQCLLSASDKSDHGGHNPLPTQIHSPHCFALVLPSFHSESEFAVLHWVIIVVCGL